jgi:TolA-binding protein
MHKDHGRLGTRHAHLELFGTDCVVWNQPAEAAAYFHKALQRTPNRPKAIFGLARSAQALGDNETAKKRYEEFLNDWKTADSDRPELAKATQFL